MYMQIRNIPLSSCGFCICTEFDGIKLQGSYSESNSDVKESVVWFGSYILVLVL